MSDEISYQAPICPICHDDHGPNPRKGPAMSDPQRYIQMDRASLDDCLNRIELRGHDLAFQRDRIHCLNDAYDALAREVEAGEKRFEAVKAERDALAVEAHALRISNEQAGADFDRMLAALTPYVTEVNESKPDAILRAIDALAREVEALKEQRDELQRAVNKIPKVLEFNSEQLERQLAEARSRVEAIDIEYEKLHDRYAEAQAQLTRQRSYDQSIIDDLTKELAECKQKLGVQL